MGMCAEIIAIGPFSNKIVNALEYPDDYYSNTQEGSIITEWLFGIAEGSSLSREFALLFGITDPWDFNQHKIKNDKININGLQEFISRHMEYGADFQKLLILLANGFEFHFRPEG